MSDSTDTDPATKAARAAKAEKIGRYVAIFVFPLIMVGMMVWGYLYAMHAPAAHNMPVSVSTSSDSTDARQAADSFAAALDKVEDNGRHAFSVTTGQDAADARRSVVDNDSVAAVVLGDDGATLYTAGAAGLSQGQSVQKLVGATAAAEGVSVTPEDVVPLPASDSAGMGAMFMTTAIVMAGYVPLSIALSFAPQLLLRKRRAVPVLAAWSALIAGLIWFVVGPVMNVIDSSDAGAVLGITFLSAFAMAVVQMFLTRILGPMAVMAGLLLLMVLGIPASGMSISLYSVPTFYQFLHSFLPTPAVGGALRAVLYYDGVGVWPHLWVLITGGAAGLLLTALLDTAKARRGRRSNSALVNLESLHSGPRPEKRFWQYLGLLFFPLAMVSMMITAMLGTMHDPAPRDMPVIVVGSTVDQAQEAADGLAQSMPGMYDFTVTDDAEDARNQVLDRDAVGAYVLPSASSPEATVVVNQAAGMSAAQAVTTTFTQIARAQELPVATDDVAPLSGRDTMGTVSLYIAIGWMMSGFMVIAVGSNAQPASRRLRTLLPLVAGYSVFMSTVVWLIAGPIVGAVAGHALPLIGTGIVAIFCVAMFAAFLERLFGLLSIVVTVGVIMFLGIPASGGAMSVFMSPPLFAWLHNVLPMAAAVESVRSILYFGSDTVGHWLLVFLTWGVVSLLLVLVVDRVKPVRTGTRNLSEDLNASPWTTEGTTELPSRAEMVLAEAEAEKKEKEKEPVTSG
ncbi:ABC transporter permease [uncultured Corynebacterium sp.]|uniref:ABC transporter permease n=1 Tax=uncultured Corynebacterium sp. TaxID=159447 RepID=UPI0025FEE924|nr:ABC transporter permease [uncultured Corynebacterium sp.]